MKGRNEREALRRKYLPETVKVLFVGESPPQGGTFFYSTDSILFDATRNGFLAAFPDRDFVTEFLIKFRGLGCYLEDLSAIPINKMASQERTAHRKAGEEKLAENLLYWKPQAIVVVMKGVSQNVRAAIIRAELVTEKFFELPFPRRDFGRYEEYVDGLGETLRGLERDHILDVSSVERF